MNNQDLTFDILIVGAGITGSFIARELSKYDLKIALLDAHNDVGDGCSCANSAIIHSGYDPVPGTLKAKFNCLGNPMWDKIADELDIDFYRCGSLTVALNDEDLPILKDLLERSKINGVEAKLLSSDEVKKMEPNISPNIKGALFAPTAGIIDPFCATVHAAENAVDNGVCLFLNNKVIDIKKDNDLYLIKTNKNVFHSKIVINASGVHSDKIASMIEDIDWKITPRKGEYFVLDHYEAGLVNHVIFPLPSKKGKGILVSMTTSGNYIVGPSSENIDDGDDVSTDKLTLDNVRSKALEMIPSIPFNQVIRVFSGNRPTCTRHDFVVEYAKIDKNFINVGGIESPGFVSSPAIAKYVVEELVAPIIKLNKKDSYNPRIRKHPVMFKLNNDERIDFVNKNPEYGQIICNCEKISLGEINDILSRNVAPTSIKGIKKRCRAGYGKCQGGFCQPKVLEILARHYNLSPLDILYNDENSNILLKKIKEND